MSNMRLQKSPGLSTLYKEVLADAQKSPSGGWILCTCLELASFLIEKNRKYGDSAINPRRILSKASSTEQILIRMDDKLNRLLSSQADEDEDVLKDLVGYWVLFQVAKKCSTKE